MVDRNAVYTHLAQTRMLVGDLLNIVDESSDEQIHDKLLELRDHNAKLSRIDW